MLVAAPVAGALAVPGTARAGGRITVTDDLGRSVDLPFPVRKVAVFNRYSVEFVRSVAGIGALAGADAGTLKDAPYWPGLTAAMAVGQSQSEPNYEAIVAAAPDVVLFPRNGAWEQAIAQLAPFGIPVLVLTAWDVLKHEENVTLLGRIFDQPERARRLNAFYVETRDLIARRLAGVPRKRVYMEEVADYRTVLKGSGWHDMIEAGGGRNVFGDVDITGQPSARGNIQGFQVDPEEILAREPEAIVKLQPGRYTPHPRAFSETVLTGIAARPGFADLAVVRRGDVFHISYYLAGGCSKITGALQLATWLYPDRFADIDPGAAMRTWLETFQGVPYPGGYAVSLREVRG
jgi:ABC-type Fe3+-hydroxamate transport system substrate-binding protein